jgi:hypothetical protein
MIRQELAEADVAAESLSRSFATETAVVDVEIVVRGCVRCWCTITVLGCWRRVNVRAVDVGGLGLSSM